MTTEIIKHNEYQLKQDKTTRNISLSFIDMSLLVVFTAILYILDKFITSDEQKKAIIRRGYNLVRTFNYRTRYTEGRDSTELIEIFSN